MLVLDSRLRGNDCICYSLRLKRILDLFLYRPRLNGLTTLFFPIRCFILTQRSVEIRHGLARRLLARPWQNARNWLMVTLNDYFLLIDQETVKHLTEVPGKFGGSNDFHARNTQSMI